MTYRAVWLDGFDEIACDNFDNLVHAQEFVLEHFASYRSQFGINRVRVCDGEATYFSLERAQDPRSCSHSSDQPERLERFNSGMLIRIVANAGPDTRARVDWSGKDVAFGGTDARNALLQECLNVRVGPLSGEVVPRHVRFA